MDDELPRQTGPPGGVRHRMRTADPRNEERAARGSWGGLRGLARWQEVSGRERNAVVAGVIEQQRVIFLRNEAACPSTLSRVLPSIGGGVRRPSDPADDAFAAKPLDD